MNIQKLHQLFLDSNGVCTDTRKISEGAIFFALKGDNFNGNKYAKEAIDKGCKYAVVDQEEFAVGDAFILVKDVLKTLQDLAAFHRNQFDIPVLGITGSNGKTTTKELIGAVLKKKYKVLVTEGNLNNHIGVPLTLLNLNASYQFAIIEMGANKLLDIKELVGIAQPTYGIITNIGSAHLEGFGSLLGVIKTKKELFDYLEENDGIIFYNNDDDVLNNILPPHIESIGYGTQKGFVTGELIKLTPFVEFRWRFKTSYTSPILRTKLVGKYNFINFLAAVCIGKYFKVDNDKICNALESYTPTNNRSQITQTENNTLIVDCYNANPTSMQSALESFTAIEHPNKIAVLGDMLELGAYSKEEHKKVVDYLNKNQIANFLVGEEFNQLTTKNSSTFKTSNELVNYIKQNPIAQALVLLKGSRGIQLEKLIEVL